MNTVLPPADDGGDFFDPSFLSELEELASAPADEQASPLLQRTLDRELSAFLSRPGAAGPLTEAEFVELSGEALKDRLDALIGSCRRSERRAAAQAVESFVVFVQALLPTLTEDGGRQIRAVVFRLAPTLIHIAHNDFHQTEGGRTEGQTALRNLETILLEIASIRLAPTESELVFKNIDRLAGLVSVGDYVVANEIVSAQLLGIISRNRLARALYRIMEIEVNVQVYLKEKLGYSTPQLRIPEDASVLAEYGPIRILDDEPPEGPARRLIQFQLPGITTLRDVVLHLASRDDGRTYDLRLDALGSVELTVPDGHYAMGLVCQPPEG